MDYEKYQALRSRVKLSKDPWRMAPRVETPDENLRRIRDLTRGAVDSLRAEKSRLEASDEFTDEGKSRRLQRFYDEEVKPIVANLRESALPEFRRRAQDDLQRAKSTAFDLPQDPYQVAQSMKGLDVVREAKANRKLSIVDLERLPFETRQAIVSSPALYSGVSEHEHAMLSKKFLAESGGAVLSSAQSYSDAVESVAEFVDHAEVAAEVTVGITRSHPMAAKGREMRADLKSEGKLPAVEDDSELVTGSDPN